MYKDTAYINKIVKKKEQERAREFHLDNIRQARPITKSPESELVHINNKKKEYQKEVRFTEIQRENRILLEKITSIMGKNKRGTFHEASKTNKSLNSGFRRRQLEGIEIENNKFLRRLQEKKSDYEATKYKQEWRKQKNVMRIMANHPLIVTERKHKRQSLNQFYQRSKVEQPQHAELTRVKVLNGINFLITVRMTPKMLQITGDCKDRREVKVIEIERDEGMEFIEEECQGRFDLIFEHLRYDIEEGVLYLIGNQVAMEEVMKQKQQSVSMEKQRVSQKEAEKEEGGMERKAYTAHVLSTENKKKDTIKSKEENNVINEKQEAEQKQEQNEKKEDVKGDVKEEVKEEQKARQEERKEEKDQKNNHEEVKSNAENAENVDKKMEEIKNSGEEKNQSEQIKPQEEQVNKAEEKQAQKMEIAKDQDNENDNPESKVNS